MQDKQRQKEERELKPLGNLTEDAQQGLGDRRSDRKTAVLMAMVFERMKRKYINRHSKNKCVRIEYPEYQTIQTLK